MLIIFAGLPGAGKTTLSKLVAKKLHATYLRMDSIEQGIKDSSLDVDEAIDAGYYVAYNIAKDNLIAGNIVVADNVNPVEESREAWLKVAGDVNAKAIEFEIICSCKTEHKRRVEERVADIPNHQMITWEDVVNGEYDAWSTTPIKIDTFDKSIEACLEEILSVVK